ncbi:MAG: MFS transporter [Deltaproteobacteria bacterium]|nr:MFS transporter [Deltaproteobacteria bacterium]MBW1914929.1 MFS transporter [Deltaproteobacteria bacterium]
MNQSKKTLNTWKETLGNFLHPKVITMLFLGFSAGIPILLIFSSLSLWLNEAGVERSTITFFAWAALGYSFKFIWAPLIDRLPFPVLTRLLGRRRGWMLVSQISVITAICWMAFNNPESGHQSLVFMAFAAVMLGFSSATQDIVIDAYRIESAGEELQALMSSTYVAGYRIGAHLVVGAGALYLASYFGSEKGAYSYLAWKQTYLIMACTMLVGITTTLIIKEPGINEDRVETFESRDYFGLMIIFICAVIGFITTFYFSADMAGKMKATLTEVFSNKHLAGFLIETSRLGAGILTGIIIARLFILARVVQINVIRQTYVDPIKDFFNRYGTGLACLLLTLVGLYRISDIVLGVISNVFYQDLGFDKKEIAKIVSVYGLLMTLTGGFIGGILSVRYGAIRILFLGALLSSATNLLFMILAKMGAQTFMLYFVISADNLSAGLATVAFVAFLSSLTNIKFTATQYAIFSSIMTLFPKIFGGYSGTIVDNLGYSTFFLITALIGIPVLLLVWLAGKYMVHNA